MTGLAIRVLCFVDSVSGCRLLLRLLDLLQLLHRLIVDDCELRRGEEALPQLPLSTRLRPSGGGDAGLDLLLLPYAGVEVDGAGG